MKKKNTNMYASKLMIISMNNKYMDKELKENWD